MRQQDNRDHPEQCEPCNELFYVTEDIQALIEWVQQKASDEHVGVLAAQTVDMAASLLRYRGHLVRHFQVTQEKLRTLRELGPTEVFLTADWAALRHGTKHKVAQNAGYGQTGRIGIHPLVAMRRATSQDQLKDGTAPGDVFIVHRIVFVTDITDFPSISCFSRRRTVGGSAQRSTRDVTESVACWCMLLYLWEHGNFSIRWVRIFRWGVFQ
jgi:hypothetical protein